MLAEVAAAGCLEELYLTLSPQIRAGAAPRITNGPRLSAPLAMRLASLPEDGGYLFLRYVRANV